MLLVRHASAAPPVSSSSFCSYSCSRARRSCTTITSRASGSSGSCDRGGARALMPAPMARRLLPWPKASRRTPKTSRARALRRSRPPSPYLRQRPQDRRHRPQPAQLPPSPRPRLPLKRLLLLRRLRSNLRLRPLLPQRSPLKPLPRLLRPRRLHLRADRRPAPFPPCTTSSPKNLPSGRPIAELGPPQVRVVLCPAHEIFVRPSHAWFRDGCAFRMGFRVPTSPEPYSVMSALVGHPRTRYTNCSARTESVANQPFGCCRNPKKAWNEPPALKVSQIYTVGGNEPP